MKPELVIISQYLLGGGSSFHRNMIANKPDDYFDIKTIYLFPQVNTFTVNTEIELKNNDIVFKYDINNPYRIAKNLAKLISNNEGAIVANLPEELLSLAFFPKKNKTVFFICHDEGFLFLVKKYSHIIDVYITHNIAIFNEIKNILPSTRHNDIFFIPHGVNIQEKKRKPNINENLKIVFLARHHQLKGLHDLPIINEILEKKGIEVSWTILGDGPEKELFLKSVSHLDNFNCMYLKTNDEVIDVLCNQDIFILPSRKDGLPVALLEAMSVGVVPIVSEFSKGIKDVIKENIGSIVEVGNNEKFAIEIEKLHLNRNELEQKSENSKALIRDNYNIKKRAKEYFDLYKNFLPFRKTNKSKTFKIFATMIFYKYFASPLKFIKSKFL